MPSVGLTVVGSQVGDVTWRFRFGGAVQEWGWGEGGPPLRELTPSRRTKSNTLSKNVPVQAACMMTGGVLALESGLEHELATWLDQRPSIEWLVAQPVLLEWGDGLKHYPDLLSVDGDGKVTLWDARPVERRDESFLVKAARTEAACEVVGWDYALFGGLPLVESLNLRWVAGARRRPEWLDAAYGPLTELLKSGPSTVGDVMAADGGRGYLLSVMWHLVWTGEVRIDMSVQWCSSTAIEWGTEVAS